MRLEIKTRRSATGSSFNVREGHGFKSFFFLPSVLHLRSAVHTKKIHLRFLNRHCMGFSSKTLSRIGVAHTIEPYTPLECVLAHHFGISESIVRRYIDIENGRHSFEELAVWLEECAIFVIDESVGTIQHFGTQGRARRQLIVSLNDTKGAVIRLPFFVRSAFLYATRGKSTIHLTQTCCRCYGIVFFVGFCVGVSGLIIGRSVSFEFVSIFLVPPDF